MLLCGATEMNGQFLGQDFNLLDRLPVTAYDLTLLAPIVRQVCKEMGVTIVHGLLSTNHVHMLVEIPPHIAVIRFMQLVKGRSSRKIQHEFPALRKQYWGQRFWTRGYFCTTSSNTTDEIILQYYEQHSEIRYPK